MRGGWVAQWVKGPTLSFGSGQALRVVRLSPTLHCGGVHAQHGVCWRVSPSAPPRLRHSPSQIHMSVLKKRGGK